MWRSPDENNFPKPAGRVCREPTGAAESFKARRKAFRARRNVFGPGEHPQQRFCATSESRLVIQPQLHPAAEIVSDDFQYFIGRLRVFLGLQGHFLK